MKKFKEWLKIRETFIVGNDKKACSNSNFQVWGSLCNKKKKK